MLHSWTRTVLPCAEDLSHRAPDTALPDAVVAGTEPLLIVGALAGG
ncbi:MAG: hypothetical protein HYY76_14530 [Acidobacteria bacterium]|nr:hypothetical protein [Acidobacteriota bacterium]